MRKQSFSLKWTLYKEILLSSLLATRLCLFFALSSSLFFCNFSKSSQTWLGDKGTKVIFLPSWEKEYLLVRPSKDTFLSYCHGRSNIMWVACMGTTWQSTSSSYFPMHICIDPCLYTRTSPSVVNHYRRSGRGCLMIGRAKFSTMSKLATLVQFSSSIIKLQTLSLTLQQI